MQAILNIGPNEIDERLLNIIKELLAKNVEITLKNRQLELKEFDAALPLDDLIQEFRKAGYSDGFVGDLRTGFETSEIYSE